MSGSEETRSPCRGQEADEKSLRRPKGRGGAGANDARRASPGRTLSEEESGSRRRRRSGGARPALAADAPASSELRRLEKSTVSGQWESNHAHAAGPARFAAVMDRTVGRKSFCFFYNWLISNKFFWNWRYFGKVVERPIVTRGYVSCEVFFHRFIHRNCGQLRFSPKHHAVSGIQSDRA